MTRLARQQCREVVHRLAHDPQRLAVVTGITVACYTDMFIALHQEVGCALVTGIARTGCRYMVDRFGCGGNPGSSGMATRTFLGRVLENTLDVTLLALQCCMNIP